MAWKHWLSRNKDWCCHCMPDCQHNGSFLVSAPNKPFSLASKARIQLHGCQPRCRSRWSLSMLISGSSSSLFIHLSCFLYLSKSSWPGFIWAVSLFPIGCLRKAFFSYLHFVETVLGWQLPPWHQGFGSLSACYIVTENLKVQYKKDWVNE